LKVLDQETRVLPKNPLPAKESGKGPTERIQVLNQLPPKVEVQEPAKRKTVLQSSKPFANASKAAPAQPMNEPLQPLAYNDPKVESRASDKHEIDFDRLRRE
jgi:hypothetical protein